jgi:hypothetical protein
LSHKFTVSHKLHWVVRDSFPKCTKNLIEHDELRWVVRESIHLSLNEMNKELIQSSMLCYLLPKEVFNLPFLLQHFLGHCQHQLPINHLSKHQNRWKVHSLSGDGHSEPAPTSAPWRIDVIWLRNSFLLRSNSLANNGGQISCFFLLPTY